LGQLFFDITSLADFFIHKDDKLNIADAKDKDDYDFEDWLSLSIINDKVCHHSQKKIKSDSKFSFLNDVTAVGMGNSTVNRLDNPVGSGLGPLEQIGYQNPTGLPAETYSLKTMPVVEAIDLVKSQAISVTLDLQKSGWLVDLLGKAFSDENACQDPEAYFNTRYCQSTDDMGLIVMTYDKLNKGISPSFENFHLQKETPRFSKLTFTVDKLFGQENQPIPIKVISESDNIVDYEISLEKLMQLVKNYPDRILIEVKSTGIDNKSIIDNKLSPQFADSSGRLDQVNKYIIFDLKALLIQKESEHQSDIQRIDVIEKTVLTKVQKIQKINQTSVERLTTQNSQKGEKPTNTAIDTTKVISERTWYKETVEDIISRQYQGIKISEASDFVGEKLPMENGMSGRVVENIDKIINQLRSRLAVISGNTQMTIRLKPESLGRITVRLSYDGNKIEALFRVENPEVRQILEAEMSRLKAELNIDNCKVESALREFNQGFNRSFNRRYRSRMPGVPAYRYLSTCDSAGECNNLEDKGGLEYLAKYHSGRIDLFI
jgi:hypothetical protein